MQYVVTWHFTKDQDKYQAPEKHVFITEDMVASWKLWWHLTKMCGYPHVEVHDIFGSKKKPELGCPNGY